MSKKQLLPCPFCGSQASDTAKVTYSESHAQEQGWGQRTFFYCNCPSCGVDNKGVVGHRTVEDARAAWNRRAPDASLRAALEAIAQGYAVCGEHDRYVVVENPWYRPDNGSDPNICIDVAALSTMRASR